MRIHDINVIADLNAEDPTAPEPGDPVEYDGTTDGKISPSDIDTADSGVSIILPQVTFYWTGPWPLLHMEVYEEIPLPEGTLTIEVHNAKNLIGITELSSYSVTGASTSETFPLDDVAFVLENILPEFAILAVQISAAYLEWAIKTNAVNPLAVTTASVVLTAAVLSVTALPVIFADVAIENNWWNHHEAGLFFLAIGFSWLWSVFGAKIFFNALKSKLTHPSPQGFLESAKDRFKNLAAFLEYSLYANIIIVSIGLFLIGRATWHFLQLI